MSKRSSRERSVLGGRTERVAYEAISPDRVRFRSLEEDDEEGGIDPAWFDRPAPDRSTERMPAAAAPQEPEPQPLPPPLWTGAHDLAAYDSIEIEAFPSEEGAAPSQAEGEPSEADLADADPFDTIDTMDVAQTLTLLPRVPKPGPVEPEPTAPPSDLFAEGTGVSGVCRRGLVAVFLGARGGVGTTTTAVNVATRIASTGRKVCLLDLDLELGAIRGVLDLQGAEGDPPVDLARIAGRLEGRELRRRLPRHKSGVRVLSGVRGLDAGGRFASDLERLIGSLSGAFDFVIIDAGAEVSERSRAALAGGDLVFLVTTQEAPSIRRGAKLVQLLGAGGLDQDRLRVVLNRYHRRGGPSPEEIERALDLPVLATVANDYRTALRSLDARVPVGEIARRRRISRDLSRLGDLVGRQPAPLTLPLNA